MLQIAEGPGEIKENDIKTSNPLFIIKIKRDMMNLNSITEPTTIMSPLAAAAPALH